MTESDSTRLKCCEHCRTPFTSVIAKARYCSDKCQRAHYRKTKQYGPFTCRHCHCIFYKIGNVSRDSYCGRACYFERKSLVHGEVLAIRRIGDRIRKPLRVAMLLRLRSIVAPEVMALRRIKASISARQRACAYCDCTYLRAKPWQRHCSKSCRDASRDIVRAKYKQTDSWRAARRAGKSKRRAIMRGACGADRIDPIKVFDRDKWRCHLCGIKTPRALRGTLDDKAPELEHIVSLADGGTHTWGNVACSCRKCNQSKGSASFGQLGLGFAA